MSKRTKKNGGRAGRWLPPLTAARVRQGWETPGGGRIRPIRAGEEDDADALLRTAGVELDPYLRHSITDGTLASALLSGLDTSREAYYTAALMACAKPKLAQGLPSLSLILVAENSTGGLAGVVAGMPPVSVLNMALDHGYTTEQSIAMSLAIAKIQGLAVAEHARGQGLATALLKRAWQTYHQLGFLLAYSSFETDRDLGGFYTRQGYTVHAPGEHLSLERLS
ncbi:MAG: GNAT family N-acetyltransferase, partial [Pseudonocardiaceae bacterium]